MTTKDFELEDKGNEVLKAAEVLEDETTRLADVNDEPSLKQEDVQGFLAVIFKLIGSFVKH